MDRIRRLFLMLVLVAPLHMLEQFALGTTELARLNGALGAYASLFANAEQATAVLVTAVGAAFLLLAYGLLAGGTFRLLSTAVFAVIAMTEFHHIVETFVGGTYNAGLFTATLSVTLGVLLLVAIRAEYRRTQIAWADVAPVYQTS
jgi:hypothetical protein